MVTRLPPHNLEAEHCVLGSILLQESMLEKAIGLLSPDDFYRDAHQEIYAAMLALFERNDPQDLITVSNLLKERNKLERAGGPAYLAGLPDIVPFASRIIHYARIVLEKAILRRLILTTTEITSRCYEGHEDIGKLVEDARRRIRKDEDGLSAAGVVLDGERVNVAHRPDGVAYRPGGVAHRPGAWHSGPMRAGISDISGAVRPRT